MEDFSLGPYSAEKWGGTSVVYLKGRICEVKKSVEDPCFL